MTQQTHLIFGTDWTGVKDYWMQKPHLTGDCTFDRHNTWDWHRLFEEVTRSRATGILLGIRGSYINDLTLQTTLTTALRAYLEGEHRFTVGTWFDTVGLPDMVNPPNVATADAVKFDFANDAHIEIGWNLYARWFYQCLLDVGVSNLPLSDRGNPILPWHGIGPNMGWGYTNLHLSYRLLDRVDEGLVSLGFNPADHIPDAGWVRDGLPLQRAYGVNGWFEGHYGPSGEPPRPLSIVSHVGSSGPMTVGVCVPSFADPGTSAYLIHPQGGQTLAQCLRAMRAASATFIMIEGHTDTEESAALTTLVGSNGEPDSTMIEVLRAHMDITNPKPEQPEQPPSGGQMKIAISDAPLLEGRAPREWLAGEFMDHADGTVGVRLEIPLFGPPDPNNGDRPSGPYPFLSVQPDGTYQGRPHHEGGYETFLKRPDKIICTYQDHTGKTITHPIAWVDLTRP